MFSSQKKQKKKKHILYIYIQVYIYSTESKRSVYRLVYRDLSPWRFAYPVARRKWLTTFCVGHPVKTKNETFIGYGSTCAIRDYRRTAKSKDVIIGRVLVCVGWREKFRILRPKGWNIRHSCLTLIFGLLIGLSRGFFTDKQRRNSSGTRCVFLPMRVTGAENN